MWKEQMLKDIVGEGIPRYCLRRNLSQAPRQHTSDNRSPYSLHLLYGPQRLWLRAGIAGKSVKSNVHIHHVPIWHRARPAAYVMVLSHRALI